jgi:hypothetical protein
MDWIDKIEFRHRAKVPIINYHHRNSIECDISIGQIAKDTSELVLSIKQNIKGNILFILSAFLKIFLYQLSLDKPFTGGLGSFKLYIMIAKHIKDFFPQYYERATSGQEKEKDSRGCGMLFHDKDINYGGILQSFLSFYGNPSNLNEFTIISLIEDTVHSNAFITFEGTKQVTSIQHAFFLASTILEKAINIRKEIIRERLASSIHQQQQEQQQQQKQPQQNSKKQHSRSFKEEDTVVPMILSDLAGDSSTVRRKRNSISIPVVPKEDYYFFEEEESEKEEVKEVAPPSFIFLNKRTKAAKELKQEELEKERERERDENVYSLSLLGTLINARELLLERNLYSMKCATFPLEPLEVITERKEAILSYCLKKLDIFSMKEADHMTWNKLEKLAPMLSCRLKSFSSYDRAISLLNGVGGGRGGGGEQSNKGKSNKRKIEMDEDESGKKGRKQIVTATHYGLVGSQFQQQSSSVANEKKLKQKKFKKRRLNSSISSSGGNVHYEGEDEGEVNEQVAYDNQRSRQQHQQQLYMPEQPYQFLSPPPPLASSLYFPPSDPYASSLPPFSPSYPPPFLFGGAPSFFQPPFSDQFYYPQQQTPFSSFPHTHPNPSPTTPLLPSVLPLPSQASRKPPSSQKPANSSINNTGKNSNNNKLNNHNSNNANTSNKKTNLEGRNYGNNSNGNSSSSGNNNTLASSLISSSTNDPAKAALLKQKIIERAAYLKKHLAEFKDKIPLSTNNMNVTIPPNPHAGNNKNKHWKRDDNKTNDKNEK